MDRLEQIAAVAGSVVQAAETARTAKVYELDDASGHQHDVVSLQVPMNHSVQVKEGHPFQDLMGVKSQDTLWQRAKPVKDAGDGSSWDVFHENGNHMLIK